jgi:putative transposase
VARKKALSLSDKVRRNWIEPDPDYSIRRQCRLAGVPRSSYHYEPVPESKENLELMRLMDEQYLRHPEFGSPRMTDWLHDQGYSINHKRVERLMRRMGIQAITPGPHTSKPSPENKVYPYLLRDVEIDHVNQVWSTDITYIPMRQGFMYLVAVIDWYSRYVISWALSNSLDSDFCVSALQRALHFGTPEIFNTDQGSQFTSNDFTSVLSDHDIAISMDGRGRALDNVFVERLWWTLKYEEIYPKAYGSVPELHDGLGTYFPYYNNERKHSALNKRTPASVFHSVG